MSTFFSLFDQIRIISLAERQDRRREVEAEFGRIGENVDGLRTRYFITERPRELCGFPSLGARGCFGSHLTILKQAAEAGAGRLLVLEDDVRFLRNFSEQAGRIAGVLAQESWDIFYGGFQLEDGNHESAPQSGMAAADPEMLIMQTHCVGFSGAVIPDIVSYLEAMLARPAGDPAGGPMHVDGAYSWYRRAHPETKTLFAAPPIALQRASKSDIYDEKLMDRLPLVKDAVRLARRLKNRMG